MINKISKLFLVATSLAPIFITIWFIEFIAKWESKNTILENIKQNWQNGIIYALVAIILTFICVLLISISKKKLEVLPISINTVKTVDKEIVGFLLVYLLPMINETSTKIDSSILIFVSILFFIVVYSSNSYHFNPLLGFMNYHFYEVTIDGGITYVLITKKNISNCKSISNVVQITEYMILEV